MVVMRHEVIDKELFKIMQDYWEDFQYQRAKEMRLPKAERCIVESSIPVIWFGDMEKYRRSPLKIVTVALNPSKNEFSEDKRFGEFEKISKKTVLDREELFVFYEALSSYFKREPYWRWFRSFEDPLNALGASYKTKNRDGVSMHNIALHIDACTAIATNSPWGKLGKLKENIRERLVKGRNGAFSLFKNLVEYLEPDVVLYAANKKEIFYEAFSLTDSNRVKSYSPGKNGFKIDTNIYTYHKDCLVVKGPNVGKPFAGLKGDFVKDTMLKIKKSYKEIFDK